MSRNFFCSITENMQVYFVQRLKSFFVRCCLKFIKRIKSIIHNKFCLKNLVCCFRNCIIIRTAFMTQGALNIECCYNLINNFILEFTAPVSMENAYFGKIDTAAEKCIIYKFCCLIFPSWVSPKFLCKCFSTIAIHTIA